MSQPGRLSSGARGSCPHHERRWRREPRRSTCGPCGGGAWSRGVAPGRSRPGAILSSWPAQCHHLAGDACSGGHGRRPCGPDERISGKRRGVSGDRGEWPAAAAAAVEHSASRAGCGATKWRSPSAGWCASLAAGRGRDEAGCCVGGVAWFSDRLTCAAEWLWHATTTDGTAAAAAAATTSSHHQYETTANGRLPSAAAAAAALCESAGTGGQGANAGSQPCLQTRPRRRWRTVSSGRQAEECQEEAGRDEWSGGGRDA